MFFLFQIGFIIVAACVMTFEARDSASKVVPARFKINYGKHDSSARSSNADRRPTGMITILNHVWNDIGYVIPSTRFYSISIIFARHSFDFKMHLLNKIK